MKLETKYGILDVREDSKGAIHINFYSDNLESTVVLEMKNSNSLILHIVNDRTTEVVTKDELKGVSEA